MPYCVLRYCKNYTQKSQGITFHTFPRPGHANREAWIKYVQKNRSEETWLPTNYSRICSQHFKDDHKYSTKNGRTFLKKSAVPCDNPTKCDDSEVRLSEQGEHKYTKKITGQINLNRSPVPCDNPTKCDDAEVRLPEQGEDKCTTKMTGQTNLNESPVPCDNPKKCDDAEVRLPEQGEDKCTTKMTGQTNLNESPVPCDNPKKCDDAEVRLAEQGEDKCTTKMAGQINLNERPVLCDTPEPWSVSVSESESVFDTPRKIVLKHKLRKESADKKKLAEKLKKVQRQNAYLKKKCASYKSILQNLKSEFGFETNVANDLMAKAEAVELHKSLMKRRKQGRHQLLYSAPLRKFALTLHYYSPAAYKYVRECYQKALPHPRTICRWYSTINAEPGLKLL